MAVSPASPSGDAQAAIETLHAFVAAVNRGDQAEALGLLAPDVTIVEDLPPYRWQGAGAGAAWLLAMWENGQRTGLTEIALELGPVRRADASNGHAYVILPGLLRLSGNGRALRADGLLTFALRQADGQWLISAFSWAGDEPK